MAKITCCLECGNALTVPGQNSKPSPAKKFCQPACRMAFNNRRRDRGAELYDLFMGLRFNRDEAAKMGIWSQMCTLASAYRDADNHKRAGRPSFQSLKDAIDALPIARSSTAGDNR